MSKYLCLLVLFASCTNQFKAWQATATANAALHTIFAGHKKSKVFNTSFEYKEYFVSGLMVLKPVSEDTFRVVFTTKTGQTLLDGALTVDKFDVLKVVQQLDRKLLLNLIANDLRLICFATANAIRTFEDASGRQMLRTKSPKGYLYYLFDANAKNYHKIIRGSKRRKKVIVDLENYKNDFPEKITFAHQNFALTIAMKLL